MILGTVMLLRRKQVFRRLGEEVGRLLGYGGWCWVLDEFGGPVTGERVREPIMFKMSDVVKEEGGEDVGA